MTIAAVRITPIALPLRAPLSTGHGALSCREGFVFEIADTTGATGHGDAMPLAAFGSESLPRAAEALRRMAGWLIGRDAAEVLEGEDPLPALAWDAPVARWGVDCALHDLRARLAGASVASELASSELLGARDKVAVNVLISGDDPDAVESNAVTAAAEGFETFKLKVGARSLSEDVARITVLRAVVGPACSIRLDANGAWTEALALQALEAFARFGIEYIEQPVAPRDLAGLKRLRDEKIIDIAADEAIRCPADVRTLIDEGIADCLVIKPAVLGGLRPAMRAALDALRGGLACTVTSFLDSAIGETAALHLAAALPETLGACGLATRALFEADVARTPAPRRGQLALPDGKGIGIEPQPERLARCTRGQTWEKRA